VGLRAGENGLEFEAGFAQDDVWRQRAGTGAVVELHGDPGRKNGDGYYTSAPEFPSFVPIEASVQHRRG
jgi:hypothetical protein